MTRARLLWQLPAEALRFDARRNAWDVRSAPGLGRARALFVPVRAPADPQKDAWTLALADRRPHPLTLVNDRTWVTVPIDAARAAPDATHYLCLLRYDQPPDRPGEIFDKDLPGSEVEADELEEVFAERLRAESRRLPNEVVLPPSATTAVAGASSANTAASRAMRPAAHGDSTAAGPAENSAPLTFAFASCQYPAGFLDRDLANASYEALAAAVKGGLSPVHLLLLGDQVYTDATYGLLDPARLDDRFRMPYEDLKSRSTGPWACLPQNLLARTRMTPDDHEFVDNWEPFYPGATGSRFQLGMTAYWEHQRRETPDPDFDVHIEEHGPGWRLFMTDSRTQRCHRSAETLADATILGRHQTGLLEKWLQDGQPDELKIVTSPAMLLPRVRQYVDDPLYLDNWQGYPASFYRLLAFVCERQVRNLVFLSGDTHLGCSVRATVRNMDTGQSAQFASHHAPALYAPYPFANESPFNLLLPDRFRFRAAVDGTTSNYECSVEGSVLSPERQGCALMHARRDGRGWVTTVSVVGDPD
jgi:PhoD-like phosphatase